VADYTRIVAATANEHKLKEIAAILAPLGYEVISRAAAGVPEFEIEETGNTFEENSLIKAHAIFDWLGGRVISLADDSGIEADALRGAPGVFSARFAGQEAPGEYAATEDGDAADFAAADQNTGQNHRSLQDRANNAKLLRLLEGAPIEQRAARFVSVITCLRPGGEPIVCRGIVEGHVDFCETGRAGFGYDPLFIPAGYDYSFGLFEPEAKNAKSHRGKALQMLAERLARGGGNEEPFPPPIK